MEEMKTGNLSELTNNENRGWIIGHFAKEPFKTNCFELRWSNIKKGEKRDPSKPDSKTLTILITGKFKNSFPEEGKEYIIKKQADYIYFDKGIIHTWEALENSLVLALRWPSKKGKIFDPDRFKAFKWYLAISIISLFLLFYFHQYVFYLEEVNNFGNWPRFLFTLVFVIIGCTLVIYDSSHRHMREDPPVFWTYFSRYLIAVIVLASIVFVIFNAVESTSNYLFYYIAGAVGVGAGYNIDFAVDILNTINKYLSRN